MSARLYLVTPGSVRRGSLDAFLGRALEGGVDAVQLRVKELEARPLLRLAEVVRRRTAEFGVLFIVNDRVDLAIAAGADGVHLGQEDLPVAAARAQLAGAGLGGAMIGWSTHREAEVRAAGGSGADYIGVGPVYATPTKPGRPAVGLDLVRFAAAHAALPFFAVGGIDLTTLPRVIEAGARRVAVVRALTEADDPGRVARAMAAMLRSAG
ncbi:MAG TPA: thiamine phosphate synthase [Actinomycetota bacterium]|nr:thiamine phosphate synthase [Actinomycetota bacterium]